MADRGRPALPDNVKELRGTFRPERSHPPHVIVLEGDPDKPDWLTGRAAEVWDEKVAIFRHRGQSARGCETALAHYCQLDVVMVEMWKRGETPSSGMLNALKVFACQFYDTPASQIAKAAGSAAPPVNPFLNRGNPPARSSAA